MKELNDFKLSGRLVADPTLVEVGEKKTAKTVFKLAVAQEGKTDEVDFIELTAWSNTAKYLSTYATKGDSIITQGRIKQPKAYDDKDGNKVYPSLQLIAEDVKIISRKKAGETATESVDLDAEEDLPF